MNPSKSSRYRWCLLLLTLLTLATFWRVRNLDFINLDDNIYVYDNPHIRDGLTWEGIQWAFGADLLFSTKNADYWQPVTFLSRMLDIQLFGMNPAGHHLMNLLFHLLNTLLLFHVLQKMTGHTGRSAMVAALFAVHPLHVEAVAWVTERKDVLSGFFWMLTLWAYGKYSSDRTHRFTIVWGWYLLVLFFFALGLMSKPMVVTLPFVLLLLDFWPLRRFESTVNSHSALRIPYSALWEKVPLLVLSAVSSILTLQAEGSYLHWKSPWIGFENSMVSYGTYLVKTAWPHSLAIFYPRPSGLPPMGKVLGSGILLIMPTLLAVRWRRSFPFFLVGWSWFLGTLVPVIGLIDITWADRFTYLPLIGLFIPLVWGAAEAMARSRLMVLGGATVGVCAILSFHQLGYWKNSIALFEHAIAVTSNNEKALNNLGVAFMDSGKGIEALPHLDRVLQIKNTFGDVRAHYNLGTALAQSGNTDRAMEQFEIALRIQPDFPMARNNLGGVLVSKGRWDEAIGQYREAVRSKPDYAEAWYNLGICFMRQGKYPEARKCLVKALKCEAEPYTADLIHRALGKLRAAK